MQTHVMGKKKTTVYLDEDILKAVKLVAASEGKKDYEVMEEALVAFLREQRTRSAWDELESLLDTISARSSLSGDEAMELAYSELRAMRAEKARSTA